MLGGFVGSFCEDKAGRTVRGGRGREKGGTLLQRKSRSVVPVYSLKRRSFTEPVGLCSPGSLIALSLPLNSSCHVAVA